jgi:hypothetical protein
MVWVAYLLLCVIAGYLGKESRLGFWGVAIASVFLTPIPVLALVILLGRSSRRQAEYF